MNSSDSLPKRLPLAVSIRSEFKQVLALDDGSWKVILVLRIRRPRRSPRRSTAVFNVSLNASPFKTELLTMNAALIDSTPLLMALGGDEEMPDVPIPAHDFPPGGPVFESTFITTFSGGGRHGPGPRSSSDLLTPSDISPTTPFSSTTTSLDSARMPTTFSVASEPASLSSISVLSVTSSESSPLTLNDGQTGSKIASSVTTVTVSISGGTVTQTAPSTLSTSKSLFRNTLATALLFSFVGLIVAAISVVWCIKAFQRRSSTCSQDHSATLTVQRQQRLRLRNLMPSISPFNIEESSARNEQTNVLLITRNAPILNHASLHSSTCTRDTNTSLPSYRPTSEVPEAPSTSIASLDHDE
ncbi:hypothetical protein SCHPADRAFT_54506 [Schizopora paradoxa]|uniref:Uncharacterized protein n=1 Tax=Schizopora paradoxa TaxID=27342 RepID=A0A0H2SD63_9AGAM|nr:hypothetical protein SCHPADRAFT_54506 [Schizopora paradoxa]